MSEPLLTQLLWLKKHTNWEYDIVLDDESKNKHRETMTALVFLIPYTDQDEMLNIMIGDVPMNAVILEHDPHKWYLIPAEPSDDCRQDDVGPFDTIQDIIFHSSLLFA